MSSASASASAAGADVKVHGDVKDVQKVERIGKAALRLFPLPLESHRS
jgi:hypothetical protein